MDNALNASSRSDHKWITDNPAAGELVDLGVIDPDSCVLFSDTCRDAPIKSFQCLQSGVIFLETASQTSGDYYSDLATQITPLPVDGLPPLSLEDDIRRAEYLGARIHGKRFIDVGAGDSGLLRLVRPMCSFVTAVGPRHTLHSTFDALIIPLVSWVRQLDATPLGKFNVAGLFRFLEHVQQPVELLRDLRQHLNRDSLVVIEVPNARDALLALYRCESFRRFTLWSQHLVLHIRESLSALAEAAGFVVETVEPIQRYSIANHLYWLAKGQPGCHAHWADLESEQLKTSYGKQLATLDVSDTIIAMLR